MGLLLLIVFLPLVISHPWLSLLGLIALIVILANDKSGVGSGSCAGEPDEQEVSGFFSPAEEENVRVFENGDYAIPTGLGGYIYTNGMRSQTDGLGTEYRENGERVQDTLIDGIRDVYDRDGHYIAQEYDDFWGITHRADRGGADGD